MIDANIRDAVGTLNEFARQEEWFVSVGATGGPFQQVRIVLYATSVTKAAKYMGPSRQWLGFPVDIKKMGRPRPATPLTKN